VSARRPSFLLPLLAAIACSTAVERGGAPAGPDPALASFAPATDKRAVAPNGVVSSAHPLASAAGVEVLRAGGNAIDAAVAAGFAISVVEPMMSGVGGGGGMLIWLQEEGRAEYVDFYSASPAAAWRRPLPDSGRASLREVAVPGAVAGFLEAHARYGRLPLADVLAPAIRLAEDGFPVYLVMHEAIAANRAKVERFPAAASRFLPNGALPTIGSTFRQPELAVTLRRIASGGAAGFYEGETARAVAAVLNAGGNPITAADLARYRPQWGKRPLCTTYRGRVVLSAPPPQTGMRVLQALNLLEHHDLAALGLPTRSAAAFDAIASALRVAAVDHGRHNNDPNWAPVPAAGVASKSFARERAVLVASGTTPDVVSPGDPRGHDAAAPAPECAGHRPYGPAEQVGAGGGDGLLPAPGGPETIDGETTHLSVADAEGNAVALSNTLSPYFGVGAWVEGFFLNSSGYDFVANSPDSPARSDWRIRSSTISPTIVLESGRVRAVIGSPGGGRIPGAVVQGLVYMLDYGLDPLEAVAMPRLLTTGGSRNVEVEPGFPGQLLGDVLARGWRPVPASPTGYARLYAIGRVGAFWVGAADPRHDGGVRGHD
jgi:gamma-glutamyltranspeptidase / glutathione hydrolase